MTALLDHVSHVHIRRRLNSHDGEDDVRPVLNRVEGNRRDHHDQEIKDPVRRGGQGVGWRSDLQRDLGNRLARHEIYTQRCNLQSLLGTAMSSPAIPNRRKC